MFVDVTDLREASMPDSPTDPAAHPPQGPPVSSPNANPSSVPVVADVRSLSNNSTSPAVNGVHTSPTGPVSPSSIGNSVTQLPPACGARQLSKLKRFLTTLQQFGSDISPEIGERVRGLVMNLVVCVIWFINSFGLTVVHGIGFAGCVSEVRICMWINFSMGFQK